MDGELRIRDVDYPRMGPFLFHLPLTQARIERNTGKRISRSSDHANYRKKDERKVSPGSSAENIKSIVNTAMNEAMKISHGTPYLVCLVFVVSLPHPASERIPQSRKSQKKIRRSPAKISRIDQ